MAPDASGESPTDAEIRSERDASGRRILLLRGRLDAQSTGGVWREAMTLTRDTHGAELVVDASAVEYCDGAGASVLLALERQQRAGGGSLEIRGLREEFERVLAMIRLSGDGKPAEPPPGTSWVGQLGRATLDFGQELRKLTAFTGQVTLCLVQALRNPRSVRGKDLFLIAERAGIGAVPIIALVGFLFGLILTFQSAVILRTFGAQILVADGLAIGLFRELGPLMTAILLTARSGSAFAAEIGTMKVNEEIDALTTMGLEPVRFLVVPRVLAAILVVPALVMVMNLAGLLGGLLFYLSLDFPFIVFWDRVAAAASPGDLLGGLFKGSVYGLIVAAVGCMRGTQTGTGASAVGESTTSAVVSGIVLIALAAAIFSVVFYVLGI